MEDQKKLYTGNDIQTMRYADEARLPGKNRIEEIKKYAHLAGIKRIGIANCVALQKEADQLKKALEGEFEVYAINCKIGKIPATELLGRAANGISCNPAGQAEYLASEHTELNIALGLCLGHDMVFSLKSKAPVTTLIVKDRQYRHNPIEAFREDDQK